MIEGLRWAGERAFLVEFSSLDEVLAFHARVVADPLGQVDQVAAARTVLLTFATGRAAGRAAAAVRDVDLSPVPTGERRVVDIDVVYDGEDLDEVAALTGLSLEAVVRAHTASEWTAAFGGFAPGFAYLAGGDPRLTVPRRDTPRTAVPAGSVALAGEFSAVYPRRSPGGWRLVGRTDAALWDLDRENPALIQPGDVVRFRAVRTTAVSGPEASPASGRASGSRDTSESDGRDAAGSHGRDAAGSDERDVTGSDEGEVTGSDGRDATGSHGRDATGLHGRDAAGSDGRDAREPERARGIESRPGYSNPVHGALPDAEMAPPPSGLEIVAPGPLSLIEDLGRPGLADIGVSASGAADTASARRANRIVGNARTAAVIEATFGGLAVRAVGDQVVALAGANAHATRDGGEGDPAIALAGADDAEIVTAGSAFLLRDGETLTLGLPEAGVRTYLAVRGGVDAPETLGSRSADRLSGIGPDPLRAGDLLLTGDAAVSAVGVAEPVGAGSPHADIDEVSRVGSRGPDDGARSLRIRFGPRDDWFDPDERWRLVEQAWVVGTQSDRVGVRLEPAPGSRPLQSRPGELPSEGVVTGAIQVPPSGEPVVFGPDHPVTGGYPVIAVVVDEDLPLLAQLAPGASVRFLTESGHESETAFLDVK